MGFDDIVVDVIVFDNIAVDDIVVDVIVDVMVFDDIVVDVIVVDAIVVVVVVFFTALIVGVASVEVLDQSSVIGADTIYYRDNNKIISRV